MVERNMCDAGMRGIVVPPGSRATSRANGSRRNLGYLSGRVPGFCIHETAGLYVANCHTPI
jgi:hypothetical protein